MTWKIHNEKALYLLGTYYLLVLLEYLGVVSKIRGGLPWRSVEDSGFSILA